MLTLLDISDCGNVTDGALATIAAGLKQLRRLYLGSCRKVTAAGIEQLSKGCPSLICLDFEGCAETTDQWLTHITVGCVPPPRAFVSHYGVPPPRPSLLFSFGCGAAVAATSLSHRNAHLRPTDHRLTTDWPPLTILLSVLPIPGV